eukprot:CAMPEP_0170179470 /NCGR_PEP_ID=MMETSP0040_2-20121228/17929_1 /TAXON_ID=641309 /ORGANISM="Lotharella oceanica, Strain CCMP622" /LENGTH=357 /DNA_ID=CAMNT_0010423583 /DNA_START=38 /DNA_END=1111 /DNA_ORIENTATION=-
MASEKVYESVSNYYGKVLSSSKDLKTSACTTASRPPPEVIEALKLVPDPIKDRYYGCGTPLPSGIQGLDLLDLGSGSGRDCYVAAALVGQDGSVTGVDMTEEQLEVATKHVPDYMDKLGHKGEPNLAFKKGFIEFLGDAGVARESMDLVISNCVINLSPNKELVLQGVYDALREGGELFFSDVYCDRRLPQHVREHDVMLGECLGGALYVEDFKRICQKVGFTDPRMLSVEPIIVTDPELQGLCGNAKFYSITYRCFKIASLETLCEDYGQVAWYKGTIPNQANAYALDDHHIFETGKPMLVCGNTASMVGETWLKPHFEVQGDRSTHFGLFDCSPVPSSGAATATEPAAAGGGGCC